MTTAAATLTYAYRATNAQGRAVSGTIAAADETEARQLIQSMNLELAELAAVARPIPVRGRALRGADLIAFNQQLAELTRAGLPVEHGLRLIAQDIRNGRLARTVRELAEDLEDGKPLPEAFEARRGRFPALYGRLVEAGIRTSNLPGMLLNLGRHMELIQRMRATLWRTLSYPVMVIVGILFVLGFLGYVVLPQFEATFRDFNIRLPFVTELVLTLGRAMPFVAAAGFLVLLSVPLVGALLRAVGREQVARDRFVLPMPLIGPVLQRNLVARWCDATQMGVSAGLDLPAAISLAGDAVGSPKLRADGDALIAALESGRPIDAPAQFHLLPATVPAAMGLASRQNSLPQTLASLSEMYQQQAEHRLALLPAVLSPLLLILIAGTIGLIILAILAPFVSLIEGLSG